LVCIEEIFSIFLGKEFAQVLFHEEPRSESREALASTLVASKYNSSPHTSPASTHSCTIRSKNSRNTERPKRSRNAGESGVVGQSLEEVVAHVPPRGKAVGDDAHQLSLATDIFMEHDQLQAKEDLGIDARTARGSVEILHHLPHEGEIEPLLKAAVEIVLRNEIFEGDVLRE
jgi:hypothetical protein